MKKESLKYLLALLIILIGLAIIFSVTLIAINKYMSEVLHKVPIDNEVPTPDQSDDQQSMSDLISCRDNIRLYFERIENIKYKKTYNISTEVVVEEPTEQIIVEEETHIPSMAATTPETPDIPEEDNDWVCYIATAYNSDAADPKGNRGESLRGRKAIAMWQSDTDYTKYKSMVEPFKSFLTNKELAAKYGALPYGTKVEMRMWNPEISDYRYLGIYEVLDDSPTTIYNLSDMAQHLSGPTGPLYFYFDWLNINYMGQSTKGGRLKGYCPNWKEEYSNKVVGWLDIWEWSGSMIIVEIRVAKD